MVNVPSPVSIVDQVFPVDEVQAVDFSTNDVHTAAKSAIVQSSQIQISGLQMHQFYNAVGKHDKAECLHKTRGILDGGKQSRGFKGNNLLQKIRLLQF